MEWCLSSLRAWRVSWASWARAWLGRGRWWRWDAGRWWRMMGWCCSHQRYSEASPCLAANDNEEKWSDYNFIVSNCLLLFKGNLGRCIIANVSGNGLQPDGTRACFLSLAWSKLKLCSANHRPGYWSNLPCDWPSTAWAYFVHKTENGPRPLARYMIECWCIISEVLQHSPENNFTGNALDINHYNDWISLRTISQEIPQASITKIILKITCVKFKISFQLPRGQWVNSLWPNYAIWWHRSGSAFSQVMVWCLMAPSHYLN